MDTNFLQTPAEIWYNNKEYQEIATIVHGFKISNNMILIKCQIHNHMYGMCVNCLPVVSGPAERVVKLMEGFAHQIMDY